ncbi:hypothetical protein K469DRAFT_717790 [Zopfia rhizophila CBS 207.26]|uniref:Uncharacterized protein n=1 Tax=Zopfia rhizophila CBS 207.26 TaxID=1314779 RepID=A0A6A6DH09_9PEZI|nr:hypothetical protein K469DRAFT_717790 [Zopfia rhizophila CBS 207.26]
MDCLVCLARGSITWAEAFRSEPKRAFLSVRSMQISHRIDEAVKVGEPCLKLGTFSARSFNTVDGKCCTDLSTVFQFQSFCI